jgi:hypothetical protein
MPAAVHDLTIHVGSHVDWVFTARNADGSAFDLTGSAIKMFITHGTGRLSLDATITNATGGAFAVSLSPAQTRALTPRAGGVRHEIERRIGGKEHPLIEGTVTLTGGLNDDA